MQTKNIDWKRFDTLDRLSKLKTQMTSGEVKQLTDDEIERINHTMECALSWLEVNVVDLFLEAKKRYNAK